MLIGAIVVIAGVGFYVVQDLQVPTLNKASSVTLDRTELVQVISDNGIKPALTTISSDKYALLGERWVRDKATFEYDIFLSKNGLSDYDYDINNCRDFALNFKKVVQEQFSDDSKSPYQPAIGVITYADFTSADLHAANILIVLDKDKQPKLMFYEPQWKAFIDLSEDSKDNVVGYEF